MDVLSAKACMIPRGGWALYCLIETRPIALGNRVKQCLPCNPAIEAGATRCGSVKILPEASARTTDSTSASAAPVGFCPGTALFMVKTLLPRPPNGIPDHCDPSLRHNVQHFAAVPPVAFA